MLVPEKSVWTRSRPSMSNARSDGSPSMPLDMSSPSNYKNKQTHTHTMSFFNLFCRF
jgi:hypothetical protein